MNQSEMVRSEHEPLVETIDVKTHFKTPRGIARAVDGVTIQIRRGQSLGVVGESGSGKTVLSRSIMGLLPRNGVIREGSVRYQGQEIGNCSDKEMQSIWGREMAMIFQDPMTSLNPVMKVGKQISESLRKNMCMSASEAFAVAEKLLHDVRIPEPARRLNQYPHELSGGMRQRVMIAIAMACGPNMLFADEPTTALDVTVQAQILELLSEQKRERNLAGGVVVQEVRSKLELRQGDVIVALTSKGQSSEITTATQFNEVLSKLDRAASITLHVRRGEANVFVTVRPETPRG
jgi:peptide/nickel transport system ATP-binding protein